VLSPYQKKSRVLAKGDDISKLLLDPISFDLNKYIISNDAEVEWQKIVEIMN
jgi:hypothetical protein